MDQQLLLDPKCPMALWVLGPRLHLRCHSVQQLLRDPMFRWVLSVLGHHLRQQFHLVPQFRKPLPFPMDRLRRLDLMFRLALWVLGPRWLRQSPRGQPRLRDLMCRTVLGHHLLRLFHLDQPFLMDRRCRMAPRFLEYLADLMCHWVLGHHLRPQFHLVPLFRTALPFRRVQQYLGHLMFRSVLWLHWHLLFLTVPPCRMDRLRPLDLMCHLALWVLGPRWLRQSRGASHAYGT